MSYQVLARKWRPKSFGTLVGQEHVVRALSHALSTGRLHHAWLFTGTRGVGKTTISRILAKALNCETGITAEPCGECAACRAIDADRFPDYVEMDAASNRGVDDMAALLDKAVYAPVQGRYKVYMIDEVHMLTGHAFNAMLKTLEEPPEHVKFILATTDPQKIPVTVLSRCLQFNLKQMPQGHIVEHLSRILEAEQVPFEATALRHVAKAAAGSMRDALSLLDQAIAHGAGKIEEQQVTHMLGTVGDDHLYAVLDGLLAGDVGALLAVADGMQARSLSFDAALQSLASLLHRIALMQYAPGAIADDAERARLDAYAQGFDAEFLQLAYQIAIHGREDLTLAPDDYAGFTMTLLRLHAFRPDMPPALGSGPLPDGGNKGQGRRMPDAGPAKVPAASGVSGAPASPPAGRPVAAPSREHKGAREADATARTDEAGAPAAEPVAASPVVVEAQPGAADRRAASSASASASDSMPPWEELPPEAFAGQSAHPVADNAMPPTLPPSEPPPAPTVRHAVQPQPKTQPQPQPVDEGGPLSAPAREVGVAVAADTPPVVEGGSDDALQQRLASGDWHGVQRALGLGGMVRELAQHCEWIGLREHVVALRLAPTHRHLFEMNPGHAQRLADVIGERLGRPVRVNIEIGQIAGETPAQRDAAERQARHREAVAAMARDPFVCALIERFDATLVEASVKPLENVTAETSS